MRKDNLYFFTFFSIAIVYLIIASFGVKYFVKASANQLISVQLESSKREANEIAKLIYYQIKNKTEKSIIIDNIQNTIKNTNDNSWFICVFDWSGKEICHPDITKVGQKVSSNETLLSSLKEEKNADRLYELLFENFENTQKENNRNKSEIIHIAPVENSDLIVAAHANIDRVSSQIKKLKTNFYIIFSIMGVLIILISFLAVRVIGSHYEKKLELKNTNLETELINLSKLNTDLIDYKERLVEKKETVDDTIETGKKRILTYMRNELVPIPIDEISYINTENTITYVVVTDGKKSTTNLSLDDIYSDLDATLFFRANRQFIISITAIEKIIKYGNSQLKIVLQSNTNVEIIISKNKAAEFKQWLNI
jgi:DNA-binding LytR/AlgR family response regulator